MKITSLAAAAALATLLMGAAAYADTAPAPAAAPAATPAKPAAKPPSAKSIECSKQADAQQLHLAQRKKFRADCMKAK